MIEAEIFESNAFGSELEDDFLETPSEEAGEVLEEENEEDYSPMDDYDVSDWN